MFVDVDSNTNKGYHRLIQIILEKHSNFNNEFNIYSSSQIDSILGEIGVLNSQEQRIVRGYFGLDNGEPKKQRECAAEMGITTSRVGKIFQNAISKLAVYESKNDIVVTFSELYESKFITEKEKNAVLDIEKSLRDNITKENGQSQGIAKLKYILQLKEVLFARAKQCDKNIPLDKMGLSTMSYNCLNRSGIIDLNSLIQLSEEGLIRIRNLGERSRKEIIGKLAEYGYIIDNKGNFINAKKTEIKGSQNEFEDFLPEDTVTDEITKKNTDIKSLEEIGLSVDVCNCLKLAQIHNFQDLINTPKEVLIKINRLGPKKYKEIVSKLQEYDYVLDENGRFVITIQKKDEYNQSINNERVYTPSELEQLKVNREKLEHQLAALEEQTKQAKELLAEYDKIIGDGKTHTEDETPDFKDE